MLGFRDILGRIRIRGSVPRGVMDPAPDSDPTPDPTPFFKDAKYYFFSYFISYNLATGKLSSVLKI